MKYQVFFSKQPVFTLEELDAALESRGSPSPGKRKAMLAYYRKQGRLLMVRRGLYAVVPEGMEPDTAPVDPFLLAGKMMPDSVLAYHTALQFHGKAYTVRNDFHYLSRTKSVPLRFRSFEFHCVTMPKALVKNGTEFFGVETAERRGVTLHVTNLERTLVDVMDRPDLSGSWEEIWRSLELVEFFNLDQVVEYALLLENATTAARVGFYLDQHREALMVEDEHLAPLRKLRPRQPHYLDRSKRTSGTLVKDWNLMVPEDVLHRTWEEMA